MHFRERRKSRLFHVYCEEPRGRISTVIVNCDWVLDAMIIASEASPHNGFKGPRSLLNIWADEQGVDKGYTVPYHGAVD
jgi:hypothetical protein